MKRVEEQVYPLPHLSRVLVKVVEEEERTRTGIFLPPGTITGRQPARGVVTHVGQGYRLPDGNYAPLGYEVGDLVMFWPESTVMLRIDGDELALLDDTDVLVILEPALTPITEEGR